MKAIIDGRHREDGIKEAPGAQIEQTNGASARFVGIKITAFLIIGIFIASAGGFAIEHGFAQNADRRTKNMANKTKPSDTQAERNAPKLEEEEGAGWTVGTGKLSVKGRPRNQINASGIEPLTYDNPFAQTIERVWYDGKLVFALSVGKLDIGEGSDIKVAKEYQPVYSVELDKKGKAKGEPEKVEGQYNIYDSVPGQPAYSPIWQFYYVEVPRDYKPNTLRSARDCEKSGYKIQKSNDFEN